MAKKVVLAGACRTAIGKMGGALSGVAVSQLGAIVIHEALHRAGVSMDLVDHVYMGCVIQAGLGQNVARQASIQAGIPIETPAVTVNVVCGSGLNCVSMAAQMIQAGDADIVVAGGMENMSRAPYAVMNGRFGYRMNNGTLVDTMVNDALWDAFHQYHMMITAENVAEQWGLAREELDVFAASSQQKCERAIQDGIFEKEIVPVPVKIKKETVNFEKDEGPRSGITAEVLATLRCCSGKANGVVTAGNASGINDGAAAVVVMSEEKAQELGVEPMATFVAGALAGVDPGVVTAGNASGINDGAAAVVVMSEEKAQELGVEPMATFVAGALAGVDPSIMGVGPVASTKKVLQKTGLAMQDFDLVEANEAFAAQSLAVARELGIDSQKLNVNGGAIALGHPVGASGCRILVTLLHEMQRRDVHRGLATLCIGGGMGCSVVVER